MVVVGLDLKVLILFSTITNDRTAMASANCSLLVSRTDFASYVQELNATTGFNVTLLEACQSDICNALWGDGNADISGIGVSTHIPRMFLTENADECRRC